MVGGGEVGVVGFVAGETLIVGCRQCERAEEKI
jgi:hypothetical protein